MSKKGKMIEQTLERTYYVVAQYQDFDDKFHFSVQSWEPSDTAEAFQIGTMEASYHVAVTREELIAKQLAQYDNKEDGLREEFNKDVKELKEQREKLLALPAPEEKEYGLGGDPLDEALDDRSQAETDIDNYLDDVLDISPEGEQF